MQDTQQKANWSSKFKSPEIHIMYLWEGVQPVKILYVEKPHHCFVSLKIRQPKIYLRSFYDLLWMIYSFYNYHYHNYSITMMSHQRKKKNDLGDIFALSLLYSAQKKVRCCFTINLLFHSTDSKVLSKLTTCK